MRATEDATVRVVLADDAREVRSALRLLLQEEFGAEIVGEVEREGDLAGALAGTHPDLVLLDWESAAVRDLECVSGLRRAGPGARIIALSRRPEARAAAMAAGVDGFASKGDGPEHLVRVVRSVFQQRMDDRVEDEG